MKLTYISRIIAAYGDLLRQEVLARTAKEGCMDALLRNIPQIIHTKVQVQLLELPNSPRVY